MSGKRKPETPKPVKFVSPMDALTGAYLVVSKSDPNKARKLLKQALEAKHARTFTEETPRHLHPLQVR